VTAWIFTFALLMAVGAMGARTLGKRRQRRVARLGVGRRPETPMVLPTFHELDRAAAAARCGCGGELIVLGEGSRTTPMGELRVVRSECAACEEEVDLFFQVTQPLKH